MLAIQKAVFWSPILRAQQHIRRFARTAKASQLTSEAFQALDDLATPTDGVWAAGYPIETTFQDSLPHDDLSPIENAPEVAVYFANETAAQRDKVLADLAQAGVAPSTEDVPFAPIWGQEEPDPVPELVAATTLRLASAAVEEPSA